MNRHLTSRAIVRARWLAELATALDDAERVLALLIVHGAGPFDSERLRLIELRAALQRLNRVRMTDDRIVGPAWLARANAS